MEGSLAAYPDMGAVQRDMPVWVKECRQDSPESAAFMSGAALAGLHPCLNGQDRNVPRDLLRARMALRAAEAIVRMQGRAEGAAALRDAVHLLRAGENPGPAGAVLMFWQRGAGVPVKHLDKYLPDAMRRRAPEWRRRAGRAGPVDRAATVLEAALSDFPREEAAALLLADAALAHSLGWTHVMPLLGVGLTRADLHAGGGRLRLACHRGIHASACDAVRLARDLTIRADRLRLVAPKLRAKGAAEAVRLFLSTDALSPAIALTVPGVGMTDRAARRFCDRLMSLGVVREMTGRTTFRLYGL